MLSLQGIEWTPKLLMQLGAVVASLILLVLLLASFLSRAKVFCQYLMHMTGIKLSPSVVRRAYAKLGRNGVRDLLIDLLIQQDLEDNPHRVTPDSKPDTSMFEVR